jgi:hypothetical protein
MLCYPEILHLGKAVQNPPSRVFLQTAIALLSVKNRIALGIPQIFLDLVAHVF